MKKKKFLRIFLIIVVVLCLAVCTTSGIILYRYYAATRRGQALTLKVRTAFIRPETEQTAEPEQVQPENSENTPDKPVHSQVVELTDGSAAPVDFAALAEVNPEIYAWLEIPDSDIDEPVLQNAWDDLYYNTHGYDGKSYLCGAVFSQKSYNSRNFEDPVTILYGHNTVFGQQGAFAQLNNYADAEFFDRHDTIYVYLPDRVLVYRVFASHVNGSEHLMEYYDFDNDWVFSHFFEAVGKSAGLYDNVAEENLPQSGDRVLTLSTCFSRNFNQRFLVHAVLREEIMLNTAAEETH